MMMMMMTIIIMLMGRRLELRIYRLKLRAYGIIQYSHIIIVALLATVGY
jgi:hypothetical protein